MFDNLRDSAESSFYEEEPNDLGKETNAKPAVTRSPKRKRSTRILGLNAQQRFVVSLMILFTTCIMGTLAMFLLGKMSL
jgi:hypothetical protein